MPCLSRPAETLRDAAGRLQHRLRSLTEAGAAAARPGRPPASPEEIQPRSRGREPGQRGTPPPAPSAASAATALAAGEQPHRALGRPAASCRAASTRHSLTRPAPGPSHRLPPTPAAAPRPGKRRHYLSREPPRAQRRRRRWSRDLTRLAGQGAGREATPLLGAGRRAEAAVAMVRCDAARPGPGLPEGRCRSGGPRRGQRPDRRGSDRQPAGCRRRVCGQTGRSPRPGWRLPV